MGGCVYDRLRLYNFVDNHDVERLYTKLNVKAHMLPIHYLLYTLPGIPSIYYGTEFDIEGRKEQWSDASLRPALRLEELQETDTTRLIRQLGKVRQKLIALNDGEYQELMLTNRQYAFSRTCMDSLAITIVNNDENECTCTFHVPLENGVLYDQITKEEFTVVNSSLTVSISSCNGRILSPSSL